MTSIRSAGGTRTAAASTSPVHRRRVLGAREPGLAVLTAISGVVLVIAGSALPSQYDSNGSLTSQIGLLTPLWELGTWYALPFVVFPLTVIGALGLASRTRLRPAASGLLVGLGLEGYLLGAPGLAIYLSAGERKAALAWMMLTVGSVLVATGGALLYARGEDTAASPHDDVRGIGLAAAVVALVGAVLVVLEVVLPVYDDGFGGGQSLVELEGVSRWLALEPVMIAGATAAGVLFFCRERSRVVIGAALVGLGGLAAVSFISVVGLTSDGDSSPMIGSILALIGALAIVAAGVSSLAVALTRPASPEPPPPDANSLRDIDEGSRETTRQLAAAAHLDPRFASRAVRDVLAERHRAVAPSFGVELAPVLRHCLSARGRHRALTMLIIGLTLPLGLALANPSTGVPLALLIFFVTWTAIFLEAWVARYRVAARHLSASNYEPLFATRYLPPGGERRVRDVARAESGNLVVYSGYSPHVGSGFNQGGWSFAVNVRKGRQDFGGARTTPKPFTTKSLYGYVTERMERLGFDDLTISDRLYVDGECIRDDPRFLPHRFGRPRSQLTSEEIEEASHAPLEVARRFHCVSVRGWGGEVVFTTFLSFMMKGASLFAEATQSVLAPPRVEYRAIDNVDPHPRIGDRLKLVAVAFVKTIALPLTAFKAFAQTPAAWSAWRSGARDRREIARNPRFDYGARTSIRELAQADGYRRYFQALDREMFGKIIEREILDAILSFLELHGVDTTELEERGAAVLNNGVIVTGGQVSAGSLAVGEKSQANNSVAQRARRATAAAKSS